MGLAVHLAVVVGHHALGGYILGLGISAVSAGLDYGEPLVVQLAQDLGGEIVSLQGRRVGVGGAKAELTVVTAVHRLGVVHIIGGGVGDFIVQILDEAGGAVIEVIDILSMAVQGHAGVGVHRVAGFAHGFGPVIPGVGGVLTGRAVQDGAGILAVHGGAVGVHDVAQQRGLAVGGVLRSTPDSERGVFAAFLAVEGLMGDHGIDIQFVGTVCGAHPVVSGVAVGRGLDRLGGECEKGQDRHRSQEQREDTAMAVMNFRVHSEPPEKIRFWAFWNGMRFVHAVLRIKPGCPNGARVWRQINLFCAAKLRDLCHGENAALVF